MRQVGTTVVGVSQIVAKEAVPDKLVIAQNVNRILVEARAMLGWHIQKLSAHRRDTTLNSACDVAQESPSSGLY